MTLADRLRRTPWGAAMMAIDWRIVFMCGPRHRFTPEQWQQLDTLGGLSPTIKLAALCNVLVLALAFSFTPHQLQAPWLSGLLVVWGLMVVVMARSLWVRPTMRRYWTLSLATAGAAVLCGAVLALLNAKWKRWFGVELPLVLECRRLGLDGVVFRLQGALLLYNYGLWVMTIWRNEYLADWLHDQRLKAEAVALTRQLATAQIQPHFLFNSLASLQHWVETRDPRASSLLTSLTAYLRATLPLFDRPLLTVAAEGEAVQHYLEVMQARWGDRLRFSMHLAHEACTLSVPPGILLTLVENAVEHGIQPRLSGGEIEVHAERLEHQLVLRVLDNGPGLPHPDGVLDPSQATASVGLRNTLLRLQQAFGSEAQLVLRNRPWEGCEAVVTVPALPPVTEHPPTPSANAAPTRTSLTPSTAAARASTASAPVAAPALAAGSTAAAPHPLV